MVVYGVLCWGIHEHKAIVNDNGDKGLNGGILVNPLSQLASLIQIQTNLTRSDGSIQLVFISSTNGPFSGE